MYVTLDCKVDCGLSTRKRILSNSEARDTSCKLTSLPNESKENFCSTYQQSITCIDISHFSHFCLSLHCPKILIKLNI